MEHNIEFEIVSGNASYEYIRELVKKICEDHEGKRNLHIKLILHDLYSEQLESLSKSNASDETIRNIIREEISRVMWSDLQARFPELVQELRAKFPALVPCLPE